MNKKVIVTGGAGFIGSHTVLALHQAGFTPIVVDNFCNSSKSVLSQLEKVTGSPVALHEVDCCSLSAMQEVISREKEGLFGVIHFAAHKAVGASVAKPLEYYRNNVGSLVSVLQAMNASQVSRLVFSSSCTVYGQPDQLPVTERSPLKAAESPYGRTKQFCEEIISDQVASGASLRAVTLRYFNPVGAHESSLIGELPLGPPENLIPYITQTAVGIRKELTVFGNDYDTPDGTCIRDYIHVVDLAEAHVKALEFIERKKEPAFNEFFNVGTGRGSSVLEVISAFEAVSGKKLNYKIGARREGDVVQTYADVTHCEKEFAWSARRSMSDAMRDAYNWQLTLGK